MCLNEGHLSFLQTCSSSHPPHPARTPASSLVSPFTGSPGTQAIAVPPAQPSPSALHHSAGQRSEGTSDNRPPRGVPGPAQSDNILRGGAGASLLRPSHPARCSCRVFSLRVYGSPPQHRATQALSQSSESHPDFSTLSFPDFLCSFLTQIKASWAFTPCQAAF